MVLIYVCHLSMPCKLPVTVKASLSIGNLQEKYNTGMGIFVARYVIA